MVLPVNKTHAHLLPFSLVAFIVRCHRHQSPPTAYQSQACRHAEITWLCIHTHPFSHTHNPPNWNTYKRNDWSSRRGIAGHWSTCGHSQTKLVISKALFTPGINIHLRWSKHRLPTETNCCLHLKYSLRVKVWISCSWSWDLKKSHECFHVLSPRQTIFGCPRWNFGIVKQLWWFLRLWLLNGRTLSYSERGSKTAFVTVLRLKIACDHFLTVSWIQHVHRTVCLLLRPTFTDQPIKCDMALKHKTAYLKLLCIPLLPLSLFF